MATGKVKWFNAQKGFGFIAPDNGPNDIFVHVTAVKAAGLTTLEEDQAVSFDIIDAPGGREAAGNLKLLR